jgi:L-ascorbate metabolism protein UlaG (beta-lactamase superfamily)
MIFPRDVAIDLRPRADRDPMTGAHVLSAWIDARFEPRACRDVLAGALAASPGMERYFRLEALDDGGVVATDELLFPRPGPWQLIARRIATGQVAAVEPDESILPVVGEVLRLGAQADPEAVDVFAAECGFLGRPLLDLLTSGPREVLPTWPVPDGPGLYRREHASLLVRSREATLLIDPITMAISFPRVADVPLGSPADEISAILITHGHTDHWHLPSILMSSESSLVPVVVPRVPRPTLLSQIQLDRALASFGQGGRAPAWGERLAFGDLEVEVLPFYGEQPVREPPWELADVRNWGNCYRIDTPDCSLVVLADSGEDPAGNMAAVVEESVRRRGPIDIVLACMRRFDSPFFGGLGHYWATIPFERLIRLYRAHEAGTLPSTTAGPEGIAAVCEAAQARVFLPYAHGYEGYGRPIRDIGWGFGEPAEEEALEGLRALLRARGLATRATSWQVGDKLSFDDGLRHRPAPMLRR